MRDRSLVRGGSIPAVSGLLCWLGDRSRLLLDWAACLAAALGLRGAPGFPPLLWTPRLGLGMTPRDFSQHECTSGLLRGSLVALETPIFTPINCLQQKHTLRGISSKMGGKACKCDKTEGDKPINLHYSRLITLWPEKILLLEVLEQFPRWYIFRDDGSTFKPEAWWHL